MGVVIKWHRMKFCGDGSILSLGCARMLLGNNVVQHSKAEVGNRTTDLFSLFLLTTCAPTTTSKKHLILRKFPNLSLTSSEVTFLGTAVWPLVKPSAE